MASVELPLVQKFLGRLPGGVPAALEAKLDEPCHRRFVLHLVEKLIERSHGLAHCDLATLFGLVPALFDLQELLADLVCKFRSREHESEPKPHQVRGRNHDWAADRRKILCEHRLELVSGVNSRRMRDYLDRSPSENRFFAVEIGGKMCQNTDRALRANELPDKAALCSQPYLMVALAAERQSPGKDTRDV